MKHFLGALAVAGLLLTAACDDKPDEEAATEETAVEEATAEEAVAADGADAEDVQAAFDEAEAGCRAAADALAVWVGKPYAEAADTINGGGVATIRVIRPGTMVTKDYRTDRLNVDLDDNDVVTRIHCG